MGISYRVAWMMLHRFRVAMACTDSDLSGEVEVDETLIDGVAKGGKRGRGTSEEIVVIAVEIKQPNGFGRIRMRHVPDMSSDSLTPFVWKMVASNSVVCTDDWRGYCGLLTGYDHRRTILLSSGDPAYMAMPGVRHVALLLKCWLEAHQGAFSSQHLQSYLEEFTFRFNHRNLQRREHLFRCLLKQAVATQPVTESDILHGYQWEPTETDYVLELWD